MAARLILSLLLFLLIRLEGKIIRVDTSDRNSKLEVPVEFPLHFEIPLPSECKVAGTNTRSYNQGQCSRKPCQTASGECQRSWQCCYEVGQTSDVQFSCANSSSLLRGSVIVQCKCQPCGKLKSQIRGTVLSSRGSNPVVLAAIMIGSEIATFTDERGKFFFELSTQSREVTLLFQEAQHRSFEKTLNMHPSLQHTFTVVLEYIHTVTSVDELHSPFELQLTTDKTTEEHGINASLQFNQECLVDESSNDIYLGPGQVLHSLYHTFNPPTFSLPAVHDMVYTDSQGNSFTINTFVMGSLTVVGESGQSLALRPANALPLTVWLKFDKEMKTLPNLHLFVYSSTETRWLDHGRMTTVSTIHVPHGLGRWIQLVGKLRELTPLWAVGFPNRVTCYVKVKAHHIKSRQDILGLPVRLQQSDDRLGKTTFYQYTVQTVAGTGACLKCVCSFGGIISALPEDQLVMEAVQPLVSNGIVMDEKHQIMFYTSEKALVTTDSRTPFYLTEASCNQNIDRRTGYFKFESYSTQDPLIKPTIFTLHSKTTQDEEKGEFCFLKVAVYDCAALTDVKVLSYSTDHQVLSMNMDFAEASDSSLFTDSCDQVGVAELRAACVEFTCGSEVHVTVYSRPAKGPSRNCRYWSSSSPVLWSVPSGHNLTSFHFTDVQKQYTSGLFHASRRELALMKCYSGLSDEPGNSMDPYTGSAVIFTCQK